MGDLLEALLGIIDRGAVLGLEKPIKVPGHPDVDVPVEIPIALSALVQIPESPCYGPPERRVQGSPTPGIPEGLDFDLATCLAYGKDAAVRVFEPMVAIMEVDKEKLVEWLLSKPPVSDVRWSQNPGCFERHLQRKHHNPLFPEPERYITQVQIHEAQERDRQDALILRADFEDLLSRVREMPIRASGNEVTPIRERIDDLLHRAAGVGGDASEVADALTQLRETLMASVREGLKDNDEALKEFEDIEACYHSAVHILNNPFVAQMLRKDTPITSEDVIPALLSETPETIRVTMQAMVGEDRKVLARQCARELLHQAREANADVPLLEEKLKALDA